MTTFEDNFWGEKNNGFYVLYTNMKHGQTSTKELVDFLRESCTVEETYSKLLSKLAKIASNSSQVGTFSPFWGLLKMLAEKLSSLHMQLVHTWSDLIKDIIRYNEEQHKKHKSVKESEASTIEAVHSIQQTTAALHKSKEIYHTRCLELERLKRENASQKDLEKAETKYKKACDEYKTFVEKYANVRNDFEGKMSQSCRNFQELEETYICQMKDFIDTYAKAWENEHALRGQVQQEFKSKCDTDLCVQKLLETYISAKATGTEKPGPIEFEEADLSKLPESRPLSPEPNDKRDSFSEKKTTDSSGSPSPVLTGQPGPLSRSVKLRVSRTWFLKGSKGKKKEKKKEKKKKDEKLDDKDNESMDAVSSQDGQDGNSYEVDEEGYRIRPNSESHADNGDKNSWYSSSDSESVDGEGKKIKVEIRPLSPNGAMTSGTIEDIRASVEALRLSPTTKRRSQTPVDKMKRSQSVSDTLDGSKPNQDLLNLDLFPASSASTPTGGNYTLPSPLSPTVDISATSSTANTPANHSNIEELLNHSGPTSPVLNVSGKLGTTNSQSSLTGFPAPPIPRPSSRNKSIISTQVASRPPGRISPSPMSRSDSSGSVTFNTTPSVGSSRGPSPLTLGMSDTIPLAVAFTETVNAYFKGTDASKCLVKITGSLMMSFPAGIVKVFTENPNPSVLSFRVRSHSPLEQVLVNKELVTEEPEQSSAEGKVFSFEMSSLIDHLKLQGEQNKSASYFNIDILKYQVKAKAGVESTPLPLISYWKCEPDHTEYRLDYRFNGTSIMGPCTLKNVSVAVTVDGDVSSVQSLPPNVWNAETNRAMWKLNDISDVSEEGSQGCIRAKFSLDKGPSTPSTTALQFTCEGATLSGADFELLGQGYRLSLSKKRFASGKYVVDADPEVKYV